LFPKVNEDFGSDITLANQLAEQKKPFPAIESERVKTIAAERDAWMRS
jgi:hypothetical protein